MIVFLPVSRLLINRYYYSWFGVALNQVGLCDCKALHFPQHPVKLKFLINTNELATSLSSNPYYQLSRAPGDNIHLTITRKFGEVPYTFTFDNGDDYRNDSGTKFDVRLADNFRTPNSKIEDNGYTMIDDLAVTDEQKRQLKSDIFVTCEWNIKFPL